MTIRPYREADHTDLCAWWTAHKWAPLPPELLPPTGFLVETDQMKLAAGFLYKTDGGWALLEFIVSNPLSDKMERSEALDVLIPALIFEAQKAGMKALFTTSDHPSLIERYKKHGLSVSDTGVTHLVRRL